MLFLATLMEDFPHPNIFPPSSVLLSLFSSFLPSLPLFSSFLILPLLLPHLISSLLPSIPGHSSFFPQYPTFSMALIPTHFPFIFSSCQHHLHLPQFLIPCIFPLSLLFSLSPQYSQLSSSPSSNPQTASSHLHSLPLLPSPASLPHHPLPHRLFPQHLLPFSLHRSIPHFIFPIILPLFSPQPPPQSSPPLFLISLFPLPSPVPTIA